MPRRPARRMRSARATLALVLLALGLFLLARTIDSTVPRSPAPRTPRGTPTAPIGVPDGLVLTTLPARAVEIVDGDTLRLADGRRIRVLGLDTEEVFRDPAQRRRAERDFAAYTRAQPRGGKYPTPAGNAAWAAARVLIEGAATLRLEFDGRDVPVEDPFGRLLAHVVLIDDAGSERLLAEALVEAGHSPYFVKYGRVLRFDDRLQAAEDAARAARRGIWGEDGPGHYPDYDHRIRWWRARAAQVDRWRTLGPAPDRVLLEAPDAAARLRARVGREETTVFGLVRDRKEDGRPRILWLRHRPHDDFPVVVFEEEVWHALDHAALGGMFVTVTGRVDLFRGRPQIVVEDARQVRTD